MGGITSAKRAGRPAIDPVSFCEKFLIALSGDTSVGQACRIAGIGRATIYKWRKIDADFASAWDQRASKQFVRDSEKIPFTLARQAAQHLRISRNGGTIVSPAQNGDWWVGSRRRSAAELLKLAISKGFEPPALVDDAQSIPCKRCGNHFEPRRPDQQFCSVSCANRGRTNLIANANVG